MIARIFTLIARVHGGKQEPEVVAEWHALVQGFCEVMCPWPPRHKDMTDDLKGEITNEHHYYMSGRALGIPAWIGIAALVRHIFF